MGKVFGLSEDVLNRLSKAVWGWGEEDIVQRHIQESGLDPADHRLGRTIRLARELIGFPRHLSQHVGGFVITRGKLSGGSLRSAETKRSNSRSTLVGSTEVTPRQ